MFQFAQIFKRVMALDSHHNFISTQYLKNKLMEFDKNGVCIDTDEIFEIVMPKIVQIYNRVMALD